MAGHKRLLIGLFKYPKWRSKTFFTSILHLYTPPQKRLKICPCHRILCGNINISTLCAMSSYISLSFCLFHVLNMQSTPIYFRFCTYFFFYLLFYIFVVLHFHFVYYQILKIFSSKILMRFKKEKKILPIKKNNPPTIQLRYFINKEVNIKI